MELLPLSRLVSAQQQGSFRDALFSKKVLTRDLKGCEYLNGNLWGVNDIRADGSMGVLFYKDKFEGLRRLVNRQRGTLK